MNFPLFVEVLCFSLFCYALSRDHSSLAIILKRKRKLGAFLVLSCGCIASMTFLWLFLSMPRVGLQCVIVVFPDHTHLRFVAQNITHNLPRQKVKPYKSFVVQALLKRR